VPPRRRWLRCQRHLPRGALLLLLLLVLVVLLAPTDRVQQSMTGWNGHNLESESNSYGAQKEFLRRRQAYYLRQVKQSTKPRPACAFRTRVCLPASAAPATPCVGRC